jgi:hypothetical protein
MSRRNQDQVAVGDTAIRSKHSSHPWQAALAPAPFLLCRARDSLPVVLLQQIRKLLVLLVTTS